jgi:pimeloyl-ACP methyl ester carboxylesterase
MARHALHAGLALCLLGCSQLPELREQQQPAAVSVSAAAQSRFVVVNGARLQYVDWGGNGAPLILLAGLGNTAWIWSDFAPPLAGDFRVLALTRRGHGDSQQTASGYGLDTLVGDIRGFMDALGIERADFVAHSLAGAELTRFAALHPDRVRRLVYLDAAYDRSTQGPVFAANPLRPAPIEDADRASVEAYLAYVRRTRPDLARYWGAPVERDLRASLEVLPGGSVRPRTPSSVYSRIVASASASPPEYGRVHAPALAIYSVEDLANNLPAEASAQQREALRRYGDVATPWRRQSIDQFRAEMSDGRVVEMDAGHHLFLHRRDEVVALTRSFLLDAR